MLHLPRVWPSVSLTKATTCAEVVVWSDKPVLSDGRINREARRRLRRGSSRRRSYEVLRRDGLQSRGG